MKSRVHRSDWIVNPNRLGAGRYCSRLCAEEAESAEQDQRRDRRRAERSGAVVAHRAGTPASECREPAESLRASAISALCPAL